MYVGISYNPKVSAFSNIVSFGLVDIPVIQCNVPFRISTASSAFLFCNYDPKAMSDCFAITFRCSVVGNFNHGTVSNSIFSLQVSSLLYFGIIYFSAAPVGLSNTAVSIVMTSTKLSGPAFKSSQNKFKITILQHDFEAAHTFQRYLV